MIDEIKLSTRSKSEDYIWFSPDRIDEDWRDKYKSTFFSPTKDVNFFVEITHNDYKAFFDKINSNKTDKEGRTIYSVLMACGKRGSESSKAFFKLFKHYFLYGDETVRQLFNREFSENFIESVYNKAQTDEVEKQIKEKLSLIVSELEDVEFQRKDISKDNLYLFTNFETGKAGFITLLEFITNTEHIDGTISLVMTSKPVTEERLLGFNHTIFSRGLCLTTGTVEGGRIEKTIKELTPETEPEQQPEEQTKPVATNSPDVNPPQTEGTTSPQNAPEKDLIENLKEKIKKLFSSHPLSKLLPIISIVIILTLILAVKSCWRNSGNDLEKKSPTQKEQQSSPPSDDSLMKSTKDTLNK